MAGIRPVFDKVPATARNTTNCASAGDKASRKVGVDRPHDGMAHGLVVEGPHEPGAPHQVSSNLLRRFTEAAVGFAKLPHCSLVENALSGRRALLGKVVCPSRRGAERRGIVSCEQSRGICELFSHTCCTGPDSLFSYISSFGP